MRNHKISPLFLPEIHYNINLSVFHYKTNKFVLFWTDEITKRRENNIEIYVDFSLNYRHQEKRKTFKKKERNKHYEKEISSYGTRSSNTQHDAMPVYADDLVTVGYAQVGHESDWRTANTQNYQDVFSEDAGYSLDLVDCDNDNAAQLEAVRTFISKIWIIS